MDILTIVVTGALSILCFVVGAKVGQAVVKGEKVEMPSIDPLKAVREHQAKKQEEMERDRDNTILHNIDAYDGTAKGQKDVPRG